MKKLNNTHRSSEAGVYIVLMAFFAVVLIGFFALAIGLGFVATSKSFMHNVANLAALGALQAYYESEQSCAGSSSFEECRRTAGIARAAQIASKNKVAGTARNFELGDIAVDYGIWHHELEQGESESPCGEVEPPCFESLNGSTSRSANAVRLSLATAPDNPLLSFFTSVYGSSYFQLSVQSDATVAPRCLAFILDASLSTATDNYKLPRSTGLQSPLPAPPEPKFYISNPDGAGLWAIRQDEIRFSNGSYRDCRTTSGYQRESGGGPLLTGILSWCNYNYGLTMDALTRDGACAEGLERCNKGFFQSDYGIAGSVSYPLVPVVFGSPYGNVLINRVIPPRPLASFLNGFNAALREVQNKATDVDKGMIAAFSGAIVLNPPKGSGQPQIRRVYPTEGLSSNFGFLVQLTNYNNIGTVDGNGAETAQAIHPNFVDKGFFPVLFNDQQGLSQFTNISGVLLYASETLSTRCPASSRKIIVLATDGIGNCVSNGSDVINPSNSSPVCGVEYTDYLASESQLLDEVAERLLQDEVALVSIFAGNYVNPNIRNLVSPNLSPELQESCRLGTAPETVSCFLDMSQAAALGYRVELDDEGCGKGAIVDCDSWEKDPERAYNNLGEEGVYFGRSIGVMTDLSLRTGGELCLMSSLFEEQDHTAFVQHYKREDGSNCEVTDFNSNPPCRLKNASRTAGQSTTMPLIYANTGVQAAECASRAVGRNPYILVSEVR